MSAENAKPNNDNTHIEDIDDNASEILFNDESVIEDNGLNNSILSDAGGIEEYFVDAFNNHQANNLKYS